MITHADIIISGFTQTLRAETGSERLWLQLRKHSTPSRMVIMREWRADWRGVAEHLSRVCTSTPVVRVYAYSWGGGGGFIRLARELEKRGIVVASVVLCDPVYRSPWLPDWLPVNPLSLTRFPKIRVPGNVAVVHWLYQRKSRPRGHQPVSTNPATVVHEGIELHCTHVHADKQHQYHELARQVSAGSGPVSFPVSQDEE